MAVNIVFINATNSRITFLISGSTAGQFLCPANASISGVVSGAKSYQAICSFDAETSLFTPKFAGDTEITLAVFTQPISDNNETE